MRFAFRASVVAGVLFGLVVLAARAARAAEGWVWPLRGHTSITRGFDPPASRYGPGHRGIDLAGVAGQVVLAAGAGRVGYAGEVAGRGVVTVLHSGGLRTTYEPVAASVQAGDQVSPGEPIGSLQPGHRGCPVAACLHWGLLRGRDYLDPLSLLGAARVRLLPLGPASPAAGADPHPTDARRGVGPASRASRDPPARSPRGAVEAMRPDISGAGIAGAGAAAGGIAAAGIRMRRRRPRGGG